MAATMFLETDVRLGRSIALIGADGGRYPYGNSLLVVGTDEGVLIDPSLSVAERAGAPGPVDRILVSHAHEDHIAGIRTFPNAAIHAHKEDLLGVQSLDGFMQVYGMPPDMAERWLPEVVEKFFYTPRPDATGFDDGHTFDLGGGLRITVVHLPGHTRGHCGFMIEPDGVFFVADIDLSSFGPYYGDHWSDLEDFERAIERCRTIDAATYVTFHHKGIVEGREAFVEQLDAFSAVIGRREHRLLQFLAEPRTVTAMVAHRIVYRPGVDQIFTDHVEYLTITRHLARLRRDGRVIESIPGHFRAA